MTRFRWLEEHTHPFGRRRDDLRLYWCMCPTPDARPCMLFGQSMGGFAECGHCHRPVIDTNLPGPGQRAAAMFVALTTGQRLVFAVVGFVAVVVFVVWPTVRPRARPADVDRARSRARLMREIRRHD